MLTGDHRRGSVAPVAADRGPGPRPTGRALPFEITTFPGRAAELGRLAAALDEDRLVTVVGPGGVGKTRLAVAAAARWAARTGGTAFFCDLTAATTSAAFGDTLADAIGAGCRRAPTRSTRSPVRWRVSRTRCSSSTTASNRTPPPGPGNPVRGSEAA